MSNSCYINGVRFRINLDDLTFNHMTSSAKEGHEHWGKIYPELYKRAPRPLLEVGDVVFNDEIGEGFIEMFAFHRWFQEPEDMKFYYLVRSLSLGKDCLLFEESELVKK